MSEQQATILIVDDVKANRLLIKGYLANNDYDFLMAEGGQEALELLEYEDVDLILLDIMMPNIGGIEVLKCIMVNKRLCHIPVVMVTAVDEQQALTQCLELGASDYIGKPVEMPILKARVNCQLSRKLAMDEVRESRQNMALKVEERTRELQQAISQLYQAQKMEAIGTLAGGIAHDFNNVLSSITGNLHLLKLHADEPDKVRRRVAMIHKSCMQASEHIRQLLCFARQESVSMAPVHIQASAQAVCDMAAASIPGGIDLSFTSPEEKLLVCWNETQFKQILLNLITNASHALEGVEHAMIRVEVSRFCNNRAFMAIHPDMQEHSYVRISVQDNGCGIALDAQEKIFEPFFTTKDVGKGTGLGLSMVIGSVNSAGGIIEVESAVGTGTEFVMYLPLYLENAHPDSS